MHSTDWFRKLQKLSIKLTFVGHLWLQKTHCIIIIFILCEARVIFPILAKFIKLIDLNKENHNKQYITSCIKCYQSNVS